MEEQDISYKKEIDLEDEHNPVSMMQMENILKKMKKSICKIKCNKGVGTGFLYLIPFPKLIYYLLE